MDSATISRAIVIYTGRGTSPFPVRSVDRLSEYFEAEVAADLAPLLKRLDEEFYEASPGSGETVTAAADHAAAVFSERHPDLTRDAIDALRWCYTYDWK